MSIETKLEAFNASFPVAKDVFATFIDLLAPNFQWINAATGEVVVDGRDTFIAFTNQFQHDNPDVTVVSTPIARMGTLANHIEVFQTWLMARPLHVRGRTKLKVTQSFVSTAFSCN